MLSSVARRNAKLVVLATFFDNLVFIIPIWLIYCVEYLGYSSTIAILLFTLIWVTSAIFEVPTGVIADRWGRKKSFILGSLLFMAYPLAFVWNLPLIFFAIVVLISGFGAALSSSVLEPLVHKSYEDSGLKSKDYHKFLSISQAMPFVARAVSGIVGAWMYTISPVLPFVAWSLVLVLSICTVVFVKDENASDNVEPYKLHLKAALMAMRSSRIIIVYIVGYVAFAVVGEALWTGYQIFYEHDGQSVVIIGWLFSIMAIFSALSSYLVRRLFVRFHPLTVLLMDTWIIFIAAFLIYQPDVSLRMLSIVLAALAFGNISVVGMATIQKIITNRLQSTVLSLYNFTAQITYVLGSVMVGLLLDNHSSDAARSVIFAIAVIVVLVTTTVVYIQTKADKFRLEIE
jgi:MFS family permease